ncbi:MAG TPA: hypothetical protein VK426_06915 [Methanobacterium sp.]|nr:hypothetical protein [Methanobacterium sp.]
MSTEKQGGALGKGLDALISKKYVKKPEDVDPVVPNKEREEELKVDTKLDLDEEIIAGVLDEIKKNPRISLWSAKSAAVLRYLRKTEPEFSISSEASILIENAVKEKYPEIWELFEELI